MRRPALAVFLLGAQACTPYAAPAPKASPAPARFDPATARECPDEVDLPDLVARHERAYGAQAALEASLPVAARGTVTVEGARGAHVLVLTKDAHVEEGHVGGLYSASGHDAAVGDWTVSGASGVREVLTGQEAVDVAFDAFVWKRHYLPAMQKGKVAVTCDASGSSVHVDVAFPRVELGLPTLRFDLRSAALLEAAHATPDGSSTRTTFEEWTAADEAGICWPAKVTTGGGTAVAHDRFVHGASCARVDARGRIVDAQGAACTAAAKDLVLATWPGSGVVRVPLRTVAGKLVVAARVGGRAVNAMLDTAAAITVLDATAPSSSAFVSATAIDASEGAQAIRIGVGELPSLDVADLHVERLPAASLTLPALRDLGDARPDVVLGYTFFALGAVRVDFVKQEVAFARRGEALVSPGAKAVRIHALRGALVTEADIEGKRAGLVLDTGNPWALELLSRWATPLGIPGARTKPAGPALDASFLLKHGSIGPLRLAGVRAIVAEQPGASTYAGFVGSAVLAQCDAVVFDHARRTLWLEGACDRPLR